MGFFKRGDDISSEYSGLRDVVEANHRYEVIPRKAGFSRSEVYIVNNVYGDQYRFRDKTKKPQPENRSTYCCTIRDNVDVWGIQEVIPRKAGLSKTSLNLENYMHQDRHHIEF